MVDSKAFKQNILNNKNFETNSSDNVQSHFLQRKTNIVKRNLEPINKDFLIAKFDREISEILKNIKEMVYFHPKKINLPYSFLIQEINGERFFDENNNLILIREYETDSIREYYPAKDSNYISSIVETDKTTGEIISKIEPTIISNDEIKFSLIIFDQKINHKYTIYKVESSGVISSITDFFENNSHFRALLKNKNTSSPEKYIESKTNENGELEIVECKLNPLIQEIKHTTSTKKISIRFENGHRIIDIEKYK